MGHRLPDPCTIPTQSVKAEKGTVSASYQIVILTVTRPHGIDSGSLLMRYGVQRAFRQRKEGYIKKLEEQVRDYEMLNNNFKVVQAENYQLRDYIINLQSRLLESQGEFPPPPSNVDGLHPGKTEQVAHSKAIAPLPPRELTAINQLRASAEQVAGGAGMIDRREDSMASSGMLYHAEEASRAKRARVGSHDLSVAQEALQGTSRSPENPRAIGREEVIGSR